MAIAAQRRGRLALLASLVILVSTSAPSPAAGQWLKKRYDPCLDVLRILTGPVSGELVRNMDLRWRAQECLGVLPVLHEWYQSNQVLYRDEILGMLEAFWQYSSPVTPDARAEFAAVRPLFIELLRDALAHPELAEQGARLANKWKVGKELKDELSVLLQEATGPQAGRYVAAYPHALQALVAAGITDSSSLPNDVLVAVLKSNLNVKSLGGSTYSDNLRTLRLEASRTAGRLLGERKCTDEEAIKSLIALLITELIKPADAPLGSNAVLEALLALGPEAVPYLANALTANPADESVRYIADFARSQYLLQWQDLRDGHLSTLLGLIGDSRAAKALLSDLAAPIGASTDSGSYHHRDAWAVRQSRRMGATANALESLFHPAIAMDAVAIMRNTTLEPMVRLRTAGALAHVFTPDARDTLYRALLDDRTTKEATKRGDLPLPAQKTDFVTRILQPLALATDFDGLARFESVFGDSLEENFGGNARPDEILERLAQLDVQVPLQVSRACGNNLDCYLRVFGGGTGQIEGSAEVFDPAKLEGEDWEHSDYFRTLARIKSALVLGRANATGKELEKILAVFAATYSDLPFEPQKKKERSSWRKTEEQQAKPGEWVMHMDDLRNAVVLGFERLGRKDPQAVLPVLRKLLQSHEAELPSAAPWRFRLQALVLLLERI